MNIDDLLYRVYGDALAIVYNCSNNLCYILEKENVKAFLNIESYLNNNDIILGKKEEKLISYLFATSNNLKEEKAKDSFTSKNPLSVLNLMAFKNKIPLSCHFELTGSCNLRCSHCYCIFKKHDSLDTEQVIKIIDDLYENGVFAMVLTGGEIFFRNDILKILEHLNKRKFLLRINTNGTLINEKTVEKLKTFNNIYRIHISLYGSIAKIHDEITGSMGSFDKTMNSIKLLKENGFSLRINTSVMKQNKDDYKNIRYKIGNELGIPVHFDPMIFPKDDGSYENLKVHLEREELKAFYDFREEERIKKGIKSAPKQKLCKAGMSFFSISHDGGVYPCLKMKRLYSKPVGNLTKDSFYDIWHNSEEIKEIRFSFYKMLESCNLCELSI